MRIANVWLFTLVLSWALVGNSYAAIIGPTNDWVPLSEGAKEFGLSQETVDMLLDAEGEVNCIRETPNGKTKRKYQTLNGWAVSNWPGKILTNAHMLFNDDHTLRTDFSNCYFIPNRVVLNEEKPPRFAFESDTALYLMGGYEPGRAYSAQDKLLVPLIDAAPTVPLKIGPVTAPVVGDEVYLVASARPFNMNTNRGQLEPMIQRCHVLSQGTAQRDHLIATSCDSQKGHSGAVFFIADPDRAGALLAVAMHGFASENTDDGLSPIDYLPPSSRNAAYGLVFDDAFFTIDTTPELPK